MIVSALAGSSTGFCPNIHNNGRLDPELRRRHCRRQQHHSSSLSLTLWVPSHNQKAFPQQTPHSGRHFTPSHPAYRRNGGVGRRLGYRPRRRRKRFMEGWYYRLTIPPSNNNNNDNGSPATPTTPSDNEEEGVSFAFIVSIEDAGNPRSDLRLACLQVVGPNDTYLVQASKDDTKFWAEADRQALGCNFDDKYDHPDDNNNKLDKSMGQDGDELQRQSAPQSAPPTLLPRQDWLDQVQSGFQIDLPEVFMGRVEGHDGTHGGVLPGQGEPGYCEFDIQIQPVCGWGNGTSTGGWLSHYSVFEPHWQVTLADANATGHIVWQNQTYHFDNAKFYAEKNWGAALPSKWYWTQCNSFPGYSQLSVTAGGGVRGLPLGGKESLGMVCVHYNHVFYEATPWTGEMQWDVTPWGSWQLRGKSLYGNVKFEVQVTYTVDPTETPGLVFRAPTPDEGMVYFCRDTFDAQTNLTLWELEWDPQQETFVRKEGPPIIDGATSRQGGAEIGGGPWWDTWTATSKVSRPILALLRLPVRAQMLQDRILRRRRRR